MKNLMRFEHWIEQLVEEPFVRLFAGRLLPQDVARHLVRALEDGERLGADGTPEVPGRYRVQLNPEDMAALQRHHPDLEAQMAQALKALTERMRMRLREPPAILLEPNAQLPLRAVLITPADRTPPSAEETRDLDLERLQRMLGQEETRAPSTHTYLIVQGEHTFDLAAPLVTVGRALDNDLIIEDRRVSRHHLRLHRRYGRYVLQDQGSSGGTTVNGFPVQEIVLRPGDVISLAGVSLIYVEQPAEGSSPSSDTRPYPPKD